MSVPVLMNRRGTQKSMDIYLTPFLSDSFFVVLLSPCETLGWLHCLWFVLGLYVDRSIAKKPFNGRVTIHQQCHFFLVLLKAIFCWAQILTWPRVIKTNTQKVIKLKWQGVQLENTLFTYTQSAKRCSVKCKITPNGSNGEE